MQEKSYDAVFIGAGLIGLACAWRAAQQGMSAIVLDRCWPGAGASGVAAGMLAPVTEAEFGEEGLLRWRAAEWFLEHGDVDEAARQLLAAEDWEAVMGLVNAHAPKYFEQGRESVVLGWTEQRQRPGSFRYAGNVLPLAAGVAAWREVEAIADALTREYGLHGLNGFDFVLRGECPVLLEVNPRYCASMELVERASGTSLFGLHLAACEGRLPARPALTPGVFGKAIVYAPQTLAAPDAREKN